MDANNAIPPSSDDPDFLPSTTDVHLWGRNMQGGKRLSRGFVPTAYESAQVKEKLKEADYARRYAELQQDVRRISLTDLYRKYRGEYNSWRRARNPKTRQSGVAFDYVSFGDFRNWLVHLGLRQSSEYTADRINFKKGYEVGNLRWASKQEQAENRKTTRRIIWCDIPYTRKGFAKFLGIPPKRLYKQLERGWPLSRIVVAAGKTLDPVEDFNFDVPALEQAYWARANKYFTLNRLDWLPQYYEDQSRIARTQGRKLKFRELSERAEWEQKKRYAERDALLSAKQDELLEQLAQADPTFDPVPICPPTPW